MSEFSPIEWTDATWNPLLGCDKCSAGCVNCYAIRTAWRLQHNPNSTIAAAYAGLVEQRPDGSLNWTGKINLRHERLREPMGWTKPRRIFVNSQSDLFHPDVPDEFIDQVFAVMALCPQHTFQVLTKRADRMCSYFAGIAECPNEPAARDAMIEGATQSVYAELHPGEDPSEWLAVHMPLPNVWLGVSVENQRAADERIPALLETPAAVRFLSCEPLLGPVDLHLNECRHEDAHVEPDTNAVVCRQCEEQALVDWVICGCESGAGKRAMAVTWADWLADQCRYSGVAFFMKQMAVNGKVTGELADFPEALRVRKFPSNGVEHNGFPTVEVRA